MQKKMFAEGSAKNAFIDGKKPAQTIPLILNVAATINRIVGNTLGPAGRNYMTPLGITNDGALILNEIRFDDEREDSIADAFEEVARRQDADAGDGTTTATTLATSLTPIVLSKVAPIETPIPGYPNVMEIKRKLESECQVAISLMKSLATPITEVDQMINVAKTAMEGHECSALLAETIFKVGKDSNVSIKDGFNGKVSVDIVPGIEYPLKIQTPSMFTNATRKESSYQRPLVIVANHVFESFSDISVFMHEMMADKEQKKEQPQPLVIVGKHFGVQFTSQVVTVTTMSKLPILLLSADGLSDDEILDIAIYTGARYIDSHPKEGGKFSLKYQDAGEVKELIAGQSQTSFIGGKGLEVETLVHGEPETQVQARIVDLETLASTEQNPNTRELLLRRAGGLKGGVATVYVDAKTAVDRYYLKEKVKDAVNSCKAALDQGVIPGGGIAFNMVADQMDAAPDVSYEYLPEALRSIHKRIVQNAGGALTIPENVIDACFTNICAIENAVAVVKILTTIEGVIADVETSFTDDLSRKLGYEQ